MPEQVERRNIDQKYRITIEKAASSTKGIDGFKVEANGDVISSVVFDAEFLYNTLKKTTEVKI